MKHLKNGYLWTLILLIGLNLYYRIASIGLFKWINDYDEGAYSLGGLSISQGQVPYRDFTLVHPPLYDLLLSGMYKIFGYNFFYGRILTILISVGCIILAYIIVSKLYNRMAGIIASFLFAIFPGFFLLWYRVVQEPLGILLILLSIYFSLDFIREKKVDYRLIITGLCLGLAITVKYTFIPVVFGIILGSLIINRGKSQGYLITGVLIGFFLVSTYFIVTNFSGFIEQTILSQLSYRSGGNNTFLNRINWFPTASFPDKVTTICIFLPYFVFLLSFLKRNWLLTVSLGVSLAFTFLYNPLEIRYLSPSFIFMILVISSFIPETKLSSQLKPSSIKVITASLFIVLCIGGSSIMRQDYNYYEADGTTYEEVVYDKTLEYLDGKSYFALNPIIPALDGYTYGEFDTFGLLFTMDKPTNEVFELVKSDYIVIDAFPKLFAIIRNMKMGEFLKILNEQCEFVADVGLDELPILNAGIYKLK